MVALLRADEVASPETVEKSESHLPPLRQPAGGPLAELAGLGKLLSDESRLRILHYLTQREELHVRAFCDLLQQSQPAVSHHLAMLKEAGLLDSRREGKHNFYRLVPERIQRYAELIFGGSPEQPRRLRLQNGVVTFSRDGEGK